MTTIGKATINVHRTISTADELLALPDESVVIDCEGDVCQKRGGLWCGYETAALSSKQISKYLPALLLWDGTW